MKYWPASKMAILLTGVALYAPDALYAAPVASDKACAMWAAFSHTMTEARDAGTSERSLNRRIDGMELSKDGFTKENADYAKAIVKMVYHDFRRKTPSEISNLMHITCKLTSP